jgi:hypothetical protein
MLIFNKNLKAQTNNLSTTKNLKPIFFLAHSTISGKDEMD